MARHYQSIDEWELYVPGIDKGNERNLYQEDSPEAITLEIAHLSKIELKKYQKAAERTAKAKGSVSDADENLIKDMFSDRVRNIKNYSIGEKQIETGLDLWEYGEQDIILDVTAALVNRQMLDGGLAKKLKLQSVGKSLPVESKENGIVPDAINLSVGNLKATYRQTIPSLDLVTNISE